MSDTERSQNYASYFLVNAAFKWARELRNKKGANAVMSDLVDEALHDIKSGKVSIEDIINLTIDDHPVKSPALPAILEEGAVEIDEDFDDDNKKEKKKNKKNKK
ncbi:MAG: hypothetical protein ABH857_05870 [Elusimicrobiota bacterium]